MSTYTFLERAKNVPVPYKSTEHCIGYANKRFYVTWCNKMPKRSPNGNLLPKRKGTVTVWLRLSCISCSCKRNGTSWCKPCMPLPFWALSEYTFFGFKVKPYKHSLFTWMTRIEKMGICVLDKGKNPATLMFKVKATVPWYPFFHYASRFYLSCLSLPVSQTFCSSKCERLPTAELFVV